MKSGIFFIVCLLMAACSESESNYIELPGPDENQNREHTDWCVKHNVWTYKQMNEHYFWYTEMPDSLSLNFNEEPNIFFEILKSPQDRFSWCETNEYYSGEEESAQNLGFEYQSYCDMQGKIMNRVLYVYSINLYQQGLKRGDFVNIISQQKTSVIEKGVIQNGHFITQCTISLSNGITRGTNLAPTIPLDSIYTINNKRIGYFVYNQFESSIDVAQIAIRLKKRGIDELILDLRYNPGGYVSTSNYLASMLAPTQQLGSLYQLQRFNDKLTKEKQRNGGSGIDSVFLNKGSITAQRNLNLSRLVVLTTKNTASASESLIIGLRPYMKVVTIGTTSCGKDVGSYTIADNNYKYQLQPITFKYYNANNESTPTTGIVPDIYVEDDLDHQRGDTNEALLKAAIEYLTGEIQIGAVKDRSVSQPKMKEVGRSSIEIKNNL